MSPALAGGLFATEPPGEPLVLQLLGPCFISLCHFEHSVNQKSPLLCVCVCFPHKPLPCQFSLTHIFEAKFNTLHVSLLNSIL